MLPDDTRQRRETTLDNSLQTQQTALTDHFNTAEVVVPYSDQAFQSATIEWLVHTNQVCGFFSFLSIADRLLLQPIQVFNHATFKSMLDIASRATKGVSLLTPKKTRDRIIHMFKQKMYLLRDRLNVCILLVTILRTDVPTLGPYRHWSNQRDLRRMASEQH
jgi:hypothetical protein